MYWLVQLIIPIAIVVILPIMIVWLLCRAQMNRDNKNAEIIIKAIESNSNIEAGHLVEALGRQKSTPEQTLQKRLLRGCIFTLVGISLCIIGAVMYSRYGDDDIFFTLTAGGVLLSVGVAYLIVFFATRKSVTAGNGKE